MTHQSATKSAQRPAPTLSSLSGAGRDKPKFYAETRNTYGQWCPCWFAEPPEVKNGRVYRKDGVGPMIRPMGVGPDGKPTYCKPVPAYLAALTLDQLFQVLSPDGRLQATG